MTMTQTVESAVSFGELVAALDEREHRVRHALGNVNVRPLRRCGNAYLWPAAIVGAVKAELRRIDASRAREPVA